MNTSLTHKIFLGAALTISALYVTMKKQTPPWTGSFTGKRIVIPKEMDHSLSTSWVFADVTDFQKMFVLQKGDECFVVTAPEWRWQDAKAGLTLVPVFCPEKGGGWTDQHILDDA